MSNYFSYLLTNLTKKIRFSYLYYASSNSKFGLRNEIVLFQHTNLHLSIVWFYLGLRKVIGLKLSIEPLKMDFSMNDIQLLTLVDLIKSKISDYVFMSGNEGFRLYFKHCKKYNQLLQNN